MDERLFFSATQRNRKPIQDVLESFLPNKGTILEVASGSGEHGIAFQLQFPQVIWQTSDPNLMHRKSISSWIKHEGLENKMPKPLNLKVDIEPWPFKKENISKFNALVTINLLHISSWSCCKSLFHGAQKYLYKKSPIIIYGPFMQNGMHTSKSNVVFDQHLKEQNPRWGIRSIEDISRLAINKGFQGPIIIKMPANNISAIFHKL